MAIALDHLILHVNDAKESVEFYVGVLGFTDAGPDGPFTAIRVSEDFVILLSPFGTKGGGHLAFSMSREEFERLFERIKGAGLPFGDSYDTVGNGKGPGRERSARGTGNSVYLFDPNEHLVEILYYDD